MDKKQVQSILSAPISFVRVATPKEKQIFADKKNTWLYTFGLASGQRFVGCIFKEPVPQVDFRAVPEHDLLSEIKEIQWGYDGEVYFGPGPSTSERPVMRVLKAGDVPQENIDFYEECLGAKGPEPFYDYTTQQHIVGARRRNDGSRRLAFSHPLREKALELKKYLVEQENAISSLKLFSLEIKRAKEHLQVAKQGLAQILTPNGQDGVGVVGKIKQQTRR